MEFTQDEIQDMDEHMCLAVLVKYMNFCEEGFYNNTFSKEQIYNMIVKKVKSYIYNLYDEKED
jgi:hypothetical protein